uniref:Uncharacterized protein n=1 Tax=Solanum tuberosum TaxID=4113 RepID=M1DMW0_SOLTU
MKICESPNPFDESPIDRIFAFCSSALSPKGKEQIRGEKEQSAYHRGTPRSSRYPKHGWENGDNSAETSQGVERDFELTALVKTRNVLKSIDWRENGQTANRRREAVQHVNDQDNDLDVDHRLDPQEIERTLAIGEAGDHSVNR